LSQQKRKARHPRIKQYFCSKPKQKIIAISQSESANASSSECKGSFDSVVREVQHSTVRISKAWLVSANNQSKGSNNQTFQLWIKLKGFDGSPQTSVFTLHAES